MGNIFIEYLDMVNDFLKKDLAYDDFSEGFFHKFKNEDGSLSDREYEILDNIFEFIDMCTTDASLLSDRMDFNISEGKLRDELKKIVEKLELR